MTEPEKSKIIALLMDYKAGVFQNKEMPNLIESILSAPSEPAETGGAEEILLAKIKVTKPKHWAYWYPVLEAMTTYAAQRCAEKDRDVQVLMSALGYTVLSDTPSILSDGTIPINGIAQAMKRMLMSKDQELAAWKKQSAKYKAQIDTLRSDLSEANKRIESIDSHRLRLIESVKKWGGSWRKVHRELKEARNEIDVLYDLIDRRETRIDELTQYAHELKTK